MRTIARMVLTHFFFYLMISKPVYSGSLFYASVRERNRPIVQESRQDSQDFTALFSSSISSSISLRLIPRNI